jgi:WD40 repeat protein
MNKPDEFLTSGRVKPDTTFSQALLQQLHQSEQEQQDMTYNAQTFPQKMGRRSVAQPLLMLAAALAVMFFSMTWLSNTSTGMYSETITPAAPSMPQPELIHRLGDYGTFITAAFDEPNNAVIVISTRGIFRHALDDFGAEPLTINDSVFSEGSWRERVVVGNGNVIFRETSGDAIVVDIVTGEIRNRFFVGQGGHWNQLTQDGTRYHTRCVETSLCESQAIITWDVATGAQIGAIELVDDVTALMLSPDGNSLFYVVDEMTIIQRDLTTGDEITLLQLERPDDLSSVVALGMSPNQQTFVVVVQERRRESSSERYSINQERAYIYDFEALLTLPLEERAESYVSTHGLISERYGIPYDDDFYYVEFSEMGESFVTVASSINHIPPTGEDRDFSSLRLFVGRQATFDPQQAYFIESTLQGITLNHAADTSFSEEVTLYSSSFFYSRDVAVLEDGVIWSRFGIRGVRWHITDEGITHQSFNEIVNPVIQGNLSMLDFEVRNDEAYIGYMINGNSYLYSSETGESLSVMNSQMAAIPSDLTFANDGLFYILHYEGRFHVYDGEEGYLRMVDYLPDEDLLTFDDTLSPDASVVLSRRYDVETGILSQWLTFVDEDGLVEGVAYLMDVARGATVSVSAYSPDGKYLLTVTCLERVQAQCSSSEIVVWSIDLLREQLAQAEESPITGVAIGTLPMDLTDVRAIALHTSSEETLLAVQDVGSVHVFSVADFFQLDQGIEWLHTINTQGQGLTFSPDGGWLVVTQAGYVDVWELP